MIKLPSGRLADLGKFASVSMPDADTGDVVACLDSGAPAYFYGADGRAFYAAQLARAQCTCKGKE